MALTGHARSLVLIPCVITSPFVPLFCVVKVSETNVAAWRSASEQRLGSMDLSSTWSSTSARRNCVSSEVVPVLLTGAKETIKGNGDEIGNSLTIVRG
jgi:hypothetical protein